MPKIATFDDWIDYFKDWQKDIALDPSVMAPYRFDAKFENVHAPEIEFGDFAGQHKWENPREIPDQRIRDALLYLIVVQGDTEFASVEQQRHLVNTAPAEYENRALARIMCEEMRHGWQMCYLLCTYFGSSGKLEAQKLLERRAFKNSRLLGSFNEPVRNWLDFFTYTQFVDRDGKFQLLMLTHSSFAPLARSTTAMLKEEAFHLGTGNDGLRRIAKAGVIPVPIIQKYFNKWVPTAYDLFGKDHSGTAHWAYVWGIKGRPNEDQVKQEADRDSLNQFAREAYHTEIQQLTEQLNKLITEGQPRLRVPDLKFRRAIGDYAGKRYSVDGQPLSEADYKEHLAAVLPSPEDEAKLAEILKQPNWIEPKGISAPGGG